MKKILIALSLLTLAACSQQEQIDVDYKITKDESKPGVKRTVEVLLSEKVDEETLRKIAGVIYEKDDDYPRVYIGYFVDENSRGGYWASTHYDPDLDIKIYGSTSEQATKLEQSEPEIEGELLGEWNANNGVNSKVYFYKHDGKHYLKTVFGDGSKMTDEVKTSKVKHGTKVEDVEENAFGEYFVINDSGWLEYWSENGNYYTAPPAK